MPDDKKKGTPSDGNQGDDDDQPQYVTVQDFGKTAAKLRGIEAKMKELQGGMLTVDRMIEIGLFEKAEDGTVTLKVAQQQKQDDKKGDDKKGDDDAIKQALAPLQRQIADLQKQNADKEKALEEERKTGIRRTKQSALVAAMAKLNAINPDRDHVHLLETIEVRDDGTFFVKSKDKYDQEVEISIDDAVKTYLDKNPELVKAQAKAGSGTPPSSGGGKSTPNGAKVIPFEQWSDMGWYANNRDKFDKGEFVRGPKPNLTLQPQGTPQ